MYVLASWSLSLVVLPQCSHPRGGGGSCPSCSMRTGNAESPWASQWSLLRGGSWSPGDPRITLHSCSLFFVPRTWPRGLHQWASVPSGFQGGLASGDPGGDGVCWFFNLRLLWVGRVPQSQLLSCPPPPPLRPRGGNTCGGSGVATCLGLPGTVPGNLCLPSSPVSQETLQSRQNGTVGHPGEKNHLSCLPCVLPTPWYVVLLLQFLQIAPFCVCHLFLPRAPADRPGTLGGWSSCQSSSLVELTVTKCAVL